MPDNISDLTLDDIDDLTLDDIDDLLLGEQEADTGTPPQSRVGGVRNRLRGGIRR